VTTRNSRCVSSSETELKNWIKSWKTQLLSYITQLLNGGKLLLVFNSAIREGLQLYSQIWNWTISNGILTAVSSNTVFGLTVCFSAVIIVMF
jgi:hypothetical protein